MQQELLQTLDEDNVAGFADAVAMGLAVDVDWEYLYGKESGFKTILQLALEEDDGEPYVAELIKAGAKARRVAGKSEKIMRTACFKTTQASIVYPQ